MELRHLRYFVAVAEFGSFSRAAEKLFIAQPPLSTQIRQLEDEVGVPLLVRHPRGVRLTAAGQTFVLEAKNVLASVDRAKLLAVQKEQGGLIRIAFIPSAAHTLLPPLLKRVRDARPQAEVDVAEMITSAQVEALRTGRIDVGLARAIPGASMALRQFALDDPFCLAIPRGHPLAGRTPIELAKASDAVFVGFTRYLGPAFFDQVISLCTDAGFSPRIRYETSTVYGVLSLVGAGLGVAVVPASSVLLLPPDVELRLLKKPTRHGGVVFIKSHERSSPLVETFTELAREVFAEVRLELKRRIPGLTADKRHNSR
jgi:DNA-binding transcriptional LysR family regulator